MVKVQIVGQPAWVSVGSGQNAVFYVTGTMRFLSEDDRVLGEGHFEERLDTVSEMTTEEFVCYAVDEMKAKLKEEEREEQWAKVQATLAPLIVEEG